MGYLAALTFLTTILITIIPGRTEVVCDFDRSCLHIYNNLKGIFEDSDHTDHNLATLCSMSHDLKDCMKKTSRRCRGDLNYHFFEKLVKDLNANIGVGKNCQGGQVKGEKNSSITPRSHEDHHRHNLNHGRAAKIGSVADPCAPKLPADTPTVGCALFGLTNLKSFSEKLNFTEINYCSLSGAWSLIDTPHFAVQITNKGGLSPLPKEITATTLITVIVKKNDCSERKTYQATFDEVPGMFSDGYTTAGNVRIVTVVESEHVQIHFPYIMTTINVIKVLDKIPIPSLTVTIKMPESVAEKLMSEPLRGLPLCFYGCPRTATMMATDSKNPSNYYKSKCPEKEEEKYQSDVPSEETEFSGSLSAEFLSQGESSSLFTNNDFVKRSERSTSTAVICASLKSVNEILFDSVQVSRKLSFPGEEGPSQFTDSSNNFSNAMNSALTSQSAKLSRRHLLIHSILVVLVLFYLS